MRPPRPEISFFSCSFRKKIIHIIGWRPPLGLALPPLRNPGPATVIGYSHCTGTGPGQGM